MSGKRTPLPSPLVGEGAEQAAKLAPSQASPRSEAGEGALVENSAPATPHPGRAERGRPSPTRGEGNEPAARPVGKTAPKEFARALRRDMTDAERKLWYALRDRRFDNYKFRRQVPI